MARVHNMATFKALVEASNLNDLIRFDLGNSEKYIKTIYYKNNIILNNGQQYNMSSRNHELFEVLMGNIEIMSDDSMASSKVEHAHARGDVNAQYRTYVKDTEKLDTYDCFSPQDEMNKINRYNVNQFIFDLDFVKRFNIDLKKAKDIIQLDDTHFITQHGIDAIKRIEKRDNVYLGIV